MASTIEDLAIRVGSYIPRSAGVGASYYSGSLRADPEKFASPDFPGVRTPARDEYLPSVPNLYDDGRLSINPEPKTQEAEPGEDTKNAQNAENPDETDKNAVGEFTPEELRVIADLQARDRDVRAHEQAHISVGGAYIRGGASYDYESGPDKKRYAVGGEVGIDASPVRDNPEATMAKMQVVRAAAMAPADPSAQDRAVAGAASREEAKAGAELSERRAAEARGDGDAGTAGRSRIVDDAVAAYVNRGGQTAALGGIDFAA